MKDGKVYCKRCGKFLGDYMTDDYFKLIRLKYCPDCREDINRERQRLWQRNRRAEQRQQKKVKDETIELLRRENALLRESIKRLSEK